jgi:hypothetical protein
LYQGPTEEAAEKVEVFVWQGLKPIMFSSIYGPTEVVP